MTFRAWTTAAAGTLLLIGLAAFPVPGEEPIKPPEEPTVEGEAVIQQIEKDKESVITGMHFSYDPAGRRDPFEPLIKPAALEPPTKRPKGIAGMVVAEIALKGLAVDAHGNVVALFRGTDNRGYTLRVGDQIYDARVIAIDRARGVVVFRQQVDDPRRIKPFRDVFKRLNPTEEDLEESSATEEEGA